MGINRRRKDVPQTVGYAVDQGWEWLRAQCAYCRRSGRMLLGSRDRGESLSRLASRMKCRRCTEFSPSAQYWVGAASAVTERPIAFDGIEVVSVGMN